MRARLAGLVPATRDLALRKIWAATIDYTPGPPADRRAGAGADGDPIEGVTVASPGGHGMMWGPGVARVAVDLAVHGTTQLVDVSRARSRSVRRDGPEPPGDRSDRAAVPGRHGRRRGRGAVRLTARTEPLAFCAPLAQIRVVRSPDEPRVVGSDRSELASGGFGRWPKRSSTRSRSGSPSAGWGRPSRSPTRSTTPTGWSSASAWRTTSDRASASGTPSPGRASTCSASGTLDRPWLDGSGDPMDGARTKMAVGLRVLHEDRHPVLLLPRPGRRARRRDASRSSGPTSMR